MKEEVKEIAKYFLPKQSTKFILKPKLESILYIPEGIFTLLKTYNEPYVTVIFNENRLFFTDSKKKDIQSYRKNIEQKLKIPNIFDNNLLVKHTGECYLKHDCTKENKCFKSGGIIGKTKNVELKTTSVCNIPLKIMNNVVIKKKRKNFEIKMKNTDDVINQLFGLDKKIEAKTLSLEKPTIQPKKVFYYKTKMSWYECRELFLKFSKEALTSLIKKKNIPLFIDNNFNLFSKKPLKTKEKKKSRLGINFNILREALRLIQLIDQSFSYEKDLALYRYKYKTMKQLKYIKEINYMYNNIKSDETPFILHRNVWLKFFGGIKTYLHENLKKLLDRIDKKREKKQKSITKQRIESKYDLDFTTNFLNSFADEDKKKAKLHLTEAIKHFKSAKKYATGDTDLDNKLECAIKTFEKDYIQKTKDLLYKLNYKKIEKVEYKKLIGRLNRLDLKKEKNRQLEYLKNGPDFNQVVFYEDFLKNKKFFLEII